MYGWNCDSKNWSQQKGLFLHLMPFISKVWHPSVTTWVMLSTRLLFPKHSILTSSGFKLPLSIESHWALCPDIRVTTGDMNTQCQDKSDGWQLRWSGSNGAVTWYLAKLMDINKSFVAISMISVYDLIRWGWDKMAIILQMTLSNEFSWMKMFEFRLKFHWHFS